MKNTKNIEKLAFFEQSRYLDLIPSENYMSLGVRKALSSVLANKYSEGYPGKRYYPGNTLVDQVERYTQEQALKLFGLLGKDWGVNVQAYSGSPANLAIYLGLIEPGGRLMGLALTSGGHLTHGHKVSASGKLFTVQQYGVNPKTQRIDYEDLRAQARAFKPQVIVCGLTAYPRIIDFKKFGAIAKDVGAYLVADISHIAGLVAAGLHPSPFPHADAVMTTTHKTLRGPRGALIFSRQRYMEAINKAVFPTLQGGPHNNQTFAIAVALDEALKSSFQAYQKQIIKNACALADALQKNGFVLYTGGTDNHLLLIDCKNLAHAAKEGEGLLERAGILANRNALPGDASPFYPSGIRLGTPAITTRGAKEKHMKYIADFFKRVLIDAEHPGKVRKDVRVFLKPFPLP